MIDGIKVTKLLSVSLMALMLSVPGLRAAYESEEPVDFTLTQLHGETMSLTDLRGNWVVLNYWATWCATCRKEIHVTLVEAKHLLPVSGAPARERGWSMNRSGYWQ